jgi:hypothetical protein
MIFQRRLKTHRVRTVAAIVMAALFVLPGEASAQDYATRAAARKLGEDGIALFDKKQFAEALEKFNLAEQLVPAPTLGLRAARCLVQLGRFVEASERYLEVTRLEVPRAQMTPAYRKAQADALIEREDLLPLIPTLTINVTGPLGDGITVLVDGEQIPTVLVGQKRLIDPGVHEVEVRRKDTSVKKKLDIVVKRNEQMELKLPPLPSAKGPQPDPVYRALAWTGIGMGASGMIVFAVSGSLAVSRERELIDKCPDRRCAPEFHGESDRYDVTRYATTTGLVVGVVGLGVGIPLLITSPMLKQKKEAAQVTWAPIVGPTMVGVRGTF